jgi:hypothetical protein
LYIDHGQFLAIDLEVDVTPTGHARRVIYWTGDGDIFFQELQRFALIPHMISGGEGIDTQLEHFACGVSTYAGASRHVFTIGDDNVRHQIFSDLRQDTLHRSPAGLADDVTDEEDSHYFA